MNSNTAKLIEVKEREEKNIADYPITNKVAKCHLHKLIIIMQLSPEGEVNSGVVIYRDSKHRGIYLALSTDPEGDSCFSIYQISWIKMKKSNFFVNLKRHLEGSFFFTIYKHFGDFSSAFLRFCCKFSKKIVFYLPANTERLTLVAFLVFV